MACYHPRTYYYVLVEPDFPTISGVHCKLPPFKDGILIITSCVSILLCVFLFPRVRSHLVVPALAFVEPPYTTHLLSLSSLERYLSSSLSPPHSLLSPHILDDNPPSQLPS